MKIVKLSKADRFELEKLDKKYFGNSHWEEEIWNQVFDDLNRNIIYAIKEQNKVLAFLMIYNWGKEKNYVKLTNIAVSEENRNKSLAKLLISKMMDEMHSLNMHDFRGETRISNFPMQKIFETFGFKRTEVLKDYYDYPTEDAYRYVLLD